MGGCGIPQHVPARRGQGEEAAPAVGGVGGEPVDRGVWTGLGPVSFQPAVLTTTGATARCQL